MILKKIVSEVGFGIPIQELFDLVIGTSTGMYFIFEPETLGTSSNAL